MGIAFGFPESTFTTPIIGHRDRPGHKQRRPGRLCKGYGGVLSAESFFVHPRGAVSKTYTGNIGIGFQAYPLPFSTDCPPGVSGVPMGICYQKWYRESTPIPDLNPSLAEFAGGCAAKTEAA